MSKRRFGFSILLAAVGLAIGTGLGLWYGWIVDPVEYVDTDIAYLHPAYRDQVVLMIAESFAADGDLSTARARLAMLALPDPASAVADLAEEAIGARPQAQVEALVRLAFALGVQRAPFAPYLSAPSGAP